MPDQPATPAGKIAWVDLTVDYASELRDFYSYVVGWEPEPVEMGDHSDYNMNLPGTGEPAAGICHARGGNADLPAQWLIYITVPDLEASILRCEQLGGKVLKRAHQFCVIQDPAGAVCALYQP